MITRPFTSFGCCYGIPLSQVHPMIRRIFGGRGIIFHGETKKIAYVSGLEGEAETVKSPPTRS